jgi:predicted ATP-grasp superfamily ATP-dependent carboligase
MTVAIVALSGRALAAAARHAGVACDVIDLFGDSDTRALASRWVAGEGTPAEGLVAAPLLATLAEMRPSGIVTGAGFESDPTLLAGMAEIAPLLGNSPDVVAAVKDPLRLAATLRRLELPHPETQLARPAESGWLEKQVGGSGGTHIRTAGARPARDRFFQRRIAGRPVSALLVANGRTAWVIGLSEQWTAPAAGTPYRYGGCAAPASVSERLAGAIVEACRAIAEATHLCGLNSLDLLVDGDRFWVLEINPRPGATLDIFDGTADASLWRMHCAGVAGDLPAVLPAPRAARAASVVYAPWPCTAPAAVTWPDWVADRPMPGSRIGREDPICTVLAEAATAEAARRAVELRAARILALLTPAAVAPRAAG